MEITQTKWISKEEAGVWLGSLERPLSARRVLELAREGRLESGRSRDPNSGQTVVRISAKSVQAFLEQKKHPRPVPDPIECEVGDPRTSRTSSRRADITNLLYLLREAAGSPLWLSLSEAAAYSGLPASILRRMVLAGELMALEVGRRRGGRWRVSRRDLEGIQGKVQAPAAADPSALALSTTSIA